MDRTVDSNNPDLNENDIICGYRIKRIAELKEINSFFYELMHTTTGARHVHISNSDTENTFSVAFKTVPVDSTGVAHILEHTVLCGSKKFPVRDPFFSMLKRSLSTFMNAFTASDWTMYPFSTQNKKDFYNLMEVYLDAAFFPDLDDLSFKQEGHRLEIEGNINATDAFKLVYKGVVYNEMKGAMSSPDQVLARSLLHVLYPSTTYGHNSGGDPAVIPTLTYDQLKAFHKRHYHPSNAFFYTYGNLPLTGHLAFIHDKVLGAFKPIDPQTDVLQQPRWSEPKKVSYPYPLGINEDPEKKCQVTVAWLATDIKDAFEVLTLVLLEHILLGNSASPLRKALIDSSLGTTLCDGTGFVPEHRDTMFACGLKDVQESDAEKIESIIFDVLNRLVNNGIDKNQIESAIHQIEFHRKEVTNHPYPYGIKLLLFFSGSWFHGADPVRTFQFDADLERLRDELGRGPFLENQLKKYFLDNSHRVLFTLVPDQLMEANENRRVAEELNRMRLKMRPSDLEKINQDAEALRQRQETSEDVSRLPTLSIDDIPPEVQIVKENSSSMPATCYQQPTAGIFYFSAAAGIRSLPERLIPLVPFFCHGLSRIGTTRRAYTDMAQRISMYTGGISLSANARTRFNGTGACVPFVSLNGKSLVRNQGRMFEIIAELLGAFDFSDLDRLRNLLLEYRAGMEANIVHNGHRFAVSLASRNFSITNTLHEAWHGIHQLQTIKGITDDLSDDKLVSIADDLALIGKTLLHRKNLKMALIGEESALFDGISNVKSVQMALAEGERDDFGLPEISTGNEIPREGWSTATAVSFVACTFETVRMAHEDSPALAVISKMLRSLYLHREIREKGGAYGGLATYNPEDGIFALASYRDPNIVATLNVYAKAMSFIKSGSYSDEDIKEAILQVCSEIDKPDPPGPAARKAFYRKIISLSDDARERFKNRLLALTRHQVGEVAQKYFDPLMDKKAVAVISSEEKLKTANEKLGPKRLELHRI